MYAIVSTGGKQYRVAADQVVRVERIQAEEGSQVTLGDVLLIGGGEGVRVGSPALDGASVTATVVRHGKGRKIRGFTYKAKKNIRRRFGHRQQFTELRINSIDGESRD